MPGFCQVTLPPSNVTPLDWFFGSLNTSLHSLWLDDIKPCPKGGQGVVQAREYLILGGGPAPFPALDPPHLPSTMTYFLRWKKWAKMDKKVKWCGPNLGSKIMFFCIIGFAYFCSFLWFTDQPGSAQFPPGTPIGGGHQAAFFGRLVFFPPRKLDPLGGPRGSSDALWGAHLFFFCLGKQGGESTGTHHCDGSRWGMGGGAGSPPGGAAGGVADPRRPPHRRRLRDHRVQPGGRGGGWQCTSPPEPSPLPVY